MRERERKVFYPRERTLGKNCIYWSQEFGCRYLKAEIQGRTSCDGMIDDVCLLILKGRPAKSLTPEQVLELKTRIPNSPLNIPPGDTIA
jgi:hypothetical protein